MGNSQRKRIRALHTNTGDHLSVPLLRCVCVCVSVEYLCTIVRIVVLARRNAMCVDQEREPKLHFSVYSKLKRTHFCATQTPHVLCRRSSLKRCMQNLPKKKKINEFMSSHGWMLLYLLAATMYYIIFFSSTVTVNNHDKLD